MRGRYLISKPFTVVRGNIFADKSAIVLNWLLRKGIEKERFSIRELAREIDVSIGLIQKVFNVLLSHGILQSEGVRTTKKFFLIKPDLLLRKWLEYYSIVEKCKVWTYRTGFQDKEEILQVLRKSNLHKQIALALHSAAECYRCKNTNLQTLELYLLDKTCKLELEDKLLLEPQDRGYEILLIEPYYKSLLKSHIGKQQNRKETLNVSPVLLTFLDLYHFPLRGREQAEFMLERIPELKKLK